MTRFMMTLEDAVELVVYAFEQAKPGDLFVQKAPAATLQVLIDALKKLLQADNPVKTIGTRHGEKLYETLLTREEMARAEDISGYFRVPADARDLNYNLFFSEGRTEMSELQDYHSHNTKRLTVEEMMNLLLKLTEVREAMGQRGIRVKS
jgi:UDP-glucose 4-epimerase